MTISRSRSLLNIKFKGQGHIGFLRARAS